MALESASYVGGRIIAAYVSDAHTAVRLYETSGKAAGDVPLPALGTVARFSAGKGSDQETFFSYVDYVTPAAIYRYDPRTQLLDAVAQRTIPAPTRAGTSPNRCSTRARTARACRCFITHRRDMKKDGNQPVLLYGYGGFNASATPTFRAQMFAWLEMGGVFAEANLRGGGEYGEAWHIAGTRGQKQNVFDDFIAAAEYLIHEGYTNPKRLAIHGRSNGGLLVGAVLLQRPDLFGAAFRQWA